MSTPAVLDPRSSIATLDFTFSDDDFAEDLGGNADAQAKRRAKAMLARFKASGPSAESDMVMDVENRAVAAVEKAAKVRKTDNGSYDNGGVLSVGFSVNSVDDVLRLRELFDREGRSYDFGPYLEVSGLMLFPQGYNGPRYGLPSSMETRNDLDDWLEAFQPKRRATAKPSRTRRKAAPKPNARRKATTRRRRAVR